MKTLSKDAPLNFFGDMGELTSTGHHGDKAKEYLAVNFFLFQFNGFDFDDLRTDEERSIILRRWVGAAHPDTKDAIEGMNFRYLSLLYPEIAEFGPNAAKVIELNELLENFTYQLKSDYPQNAERALASILKRENPFGIRGHAMVRFQALEAILNLIADGSRLTKAIRSGTAVLTYDLPRKKIVGDNSSTLANKTVKLLGIVPEELFSDYDDMTLQAVFRSSMIALNTFDLVGAKYDFIAYEKKRSESFHYTKAHYKLLMKKYMSLVKDLKSI